MNTKNTCGPLICAIAAVAMAPQHALGSQLSCYEDKRTNAHTCYSAAKLREKDGIRQSPLYTGGPKGVRETGMSIHVNCKTSVVHLKDRDGVTFAGGYGNETEAVSSLKRWICAETMGKKK